MTSIRPIGNKFGWKTLVSICWLVCFAPRQAAANSDPCRIEFHYRDGAVSSHYITTYGSTNGNIRHCRNMCERVLSRMSPPLAPQDGYNCIIGTTVAAHRPTWAEQCVSQVSARYRPPITDRAVSQAFGEELATCYGLTGDARTLLGWAVHPQCAGFVRIGALGLMPYEAAAGKALTNRASSEAVNMSSVINCRQAVNFIAQNRNAVTLGKLTYLGAVESFSPDHLPIGYHDGINGTATWGWACDPDHPAIALGIHFYQDGPAGAGGTFVGSTTANVPREAGVGSLCGGNSNHGFSWSLPASLRGKAHSLYAYAINPDPGPNPQLSTTPVGTPNQMPIGNHDVGGPTRTLGWACDPNHPATALQIHFYKDGPAGGGGTFVGATTANITREAAVGNLCGGHPSHGFSWPLPASLRDACHSLYAYAIDVDGGLNPLLSASPHKSCEVPPNLPPKGHHDPATTTTARGWSCDPNHWAKALVIHFYKDGPAGSGRFIGATTASVLRESAVGTACNGNRSHGFSWQLPAGTRGHRLYAYSIDPDKGTNPLLGMQVVP